jgi:hypothetical protein
MLSITEGKSTPSLVPLAGGPPGGSDWLSRDGVREAVEIVTGSPEAMDVGACWVPSKAERSITVDPSVKLLSQAPM